VPKLKWGSDLTSTDVEEASDGYKGKVPPPGLYRFKLRMAQSTKSSNDNPMVVLLLILDGSWKKEHKQYEGAPLWDRITVIKTTAGRVKAFCDALNVTYDDFLAKTMSDEEGNITKVGKLKIKDEDLLLYIKTGTEKYEGEDRLKVARNGMLPFKAEDDDADSDDDSDADADDDDDDDKDGDDPF
jgi:hypothetical protein